MTFQGAKRQENDLQGQFMQLMLAQLKYQDPMEPLKEGEFFTQMAQFSVASGVETLNKNLEETLGILLYSLQSQRFTAAASLVGKRCGWETESGLFDGVIQGVSYKDGGVLLLCGEHRVPLEHVTFVGGMTGGDTDD